MQSIRVVFTKRANPVSYAIRWAIPQSRFSLAPASHCLIVDGDQAIEANMLHGVRRVPLVEALAGAEVVATVDYIVPNAEAGLCWARSEAARGANYDFKGAFGLLEPGRNWQDPDKWFCFEFAAMAIHQAGRVMFRNVSHISGATLLAVDPMLRAA